MVVARVVISNERVIIIDLVNSLTDTAPSTLNDASFIISPVVDNVYTKPLFAVSPVVKPSDHSVFCRATTSLFEGNQPPDNPGASTVALQCRLYQMLLA